MTSIHSGLSLTAERHDDGEEITVASLAVVSTQSAVRINVYENIPFAGGDGDYSILSVLFGPHSIGEGICNFLLHIHVCLYHNKVHACRKAVMDFPWMDAVSHIKGSNKAWRASFPCASAVNVQCHNNIVDADFLHIRGDAHVRLRYCSQVTVTGAAFMNLRGILTLVRRATAIKNYHPITDATFVNLRKIQSLDMSLCSRAI